MQTMDVDQEPMVVDATSMQVQALPIELSEKAEGKKPLVLVTVDSLHPFDLESYIAAYNGQTEVQRLLYIIEHCPTLAEAAFQHAVKRIKTRRDPFAYGTAVELYNASPGASEAVEVDTSWLDQVNAKNTSERNKLETELKTYQSNMIKESIRMAHRDLANFYRSIGDHNSALKHYTKSREYCTNSRHVFEMTMSMIELVIEQSNHIQLSTYVLKAESMLDVQPTSQAASGSSTQKKSDQLEVKASMQTKLHVAAALAALGHSNYEKAAHSFLKVGPPKGLEEWEGMIITPSDIAIYGSLCALASLSRGAIEAQIMKGEHFVSYLEQEPYVRELVNAYMGSKFKTVLEILDKYSARHQLDIYLGAHILNLTNLIRDRALVLYFRPFANVRLEKMSAAFGIDQQELETLVLGLIQSKQINGRLDSRNKILKANVTDQRAVLFSRAAQAGKQIQSSNRKLLLRLRLQQADLIIRSSEKGKNQHQQQQMYTTLGQGFPMLDGFNQVVNEI